MKRVRMTFRPDGIEVHPVYDLIAGGAEYLSNVQLVNWNVSADPAGFLIRAEGDPEAMAEDLDNIPEVLHQEFIRMNDDEFYVYHTCEKNPLTDALFDAFSNQSLLVVFPMEYHDDGSSTITVVGPNKDIQRVLEDVPDGLKVDIDAVGGPEVGNEGVASNLSDRQLEAVTAALEVGYYNVPRQATSEEVSEKMGCEPSTASEHLRKAETKLINDIFGENQSV